MKATCANCKRECASAAEDVDSLCTGCKYLPKSKRSQKRPVTAGERAEILQRKARSTRVGQEVVVAGMKLKRVDARGGNHQRFNFPVEQLELVQE
jgi:hypothetical protein